MEQTLTLHMSLEDFKAVVAEQVSEAISKLPIISNVPDGNKYWTAEEIALCSDYSHSRLLEKIRNAKLDTERLDQKIAIRYSDIEKLGVTVNPLKLAKIRGEK